MAPEIERQSKYPSPLYWVTIGRVSKLMFRAMVNTQYLVSANAVNKPPQKAETIPTAGLKFEAVAKLMFIGKFTNATLMLATKLSFQCQSSMSKKLFALYSLVTTTFSSPSSSLSGWSFWLFRAVVVFSRAKFDGAFNDDLMIAGVLNESLCKMPILFLFSFSSKLIFDFLS